MGTNFIDFNNPQNKLNNCDFIALDTCSILNLVSGDQQALNFARFTLNNDITLCYTIKSVEELHIIKEAQNIPKNKRMALPNMGNYLQQSYAEANTILATINSLPNMYDEPIGNINAEVLRQAEINAITHKLRWGDAIIYTLVKQNNIGHIWTFDKDWSNVIDSSMSILTEQRFIPNSGSIMNNLTSNIINN